MTKLHTQLFKKRIGVYYYRDSLFLNLFFFLQKEVETNINHI